MTLYRTHRAADYFVLQEQGLPAMFHHHSAEPLWGTFDPGVSDALGPLEAVPEKEATEILAGLADWRRNRFLASPFTGLSAMPHFYGASIDWKEGRAVHVVLPPWHNLEGVEEALKALGHVMVPLPWHGRDDGFIARGIRAIHSPEALANSVADKLTAEQRLSIAGTSVVDPGEWAKAILTILRGMVSIHTFAGWGGQEIHAFLEKLHTRAVQDAAELNEEMPHQRCARGIHEPMQTEPEICVYCAKPVHEAVA